MVDAFRIKFPMVEMLVFCASSMFTIISLNHLAKLQKRYDATLGVFWEITSTN